MRPTAHRNSGEPFRAPGPCFQAGDTVRIGATCETVDNRWTWDIGGPNEHPMRKICGGKGRVGVLGQRCCLPL